MKVVSVVLAWMTKVSLGGLLRGKRKGNHFDEKFAMILLSVSIAQSEARRSRLEMPETPIKMKSRVEENTLNRKISWIINKKA